MVVDIALEYIPIFNWQVLMPTGALTPGILSAQRLMNDLAATYSPGVVIYIEWAGAALKTPLLAIAALPLLT
jgi:hypothetical protein